MIEVVNLDISSRGFQILPIDNYFHLTSADGLYYPYPIDGGVKVVPKLLITDITNGILYTSQVCKHHKLTIETGTKIYTFDSAGKEYLDSEGQSKWYYGFFPIINNRIKNQLRITDAPAIFDDAPYKGLNPWWNKIDYEIDFETWFQYKEDLNSDDLIPLFSFNWYLKASIKQNNGVWEIVSSDFSGEKKIRESIKYHGIGDIPNMPGQLKNLFQAVKEFESEHEELTRKM